MGFTLVLHGSTAFLVPPWTTAATATAMLPSLRRLGAVGYIARAKELGRQSLLGTFHSTGERFDAILKGREN